SCRRDRSSRDTWYAREGRCHSSSGACHDRIAWGPSWPGGCVGSHLTSCLLLVSRSRRGLDEYQMLAAERLTPFCRREAAALTLKGGPADMARLVRTLRVRRGAPCREKGCPS